ncbi:SEC-C domain-containing protein [Neogemmobacter tilapiae]|uniref:SEC-C domain-containing protein n=1 Tax=Neogemmobacter tilapiae TaxID=875041 RepID=A0A918TUS2_9RHOB|nr:SEC-C domain-containing protein [Gemmobacter tilapiae]GHC62790.1 hypothetical protein GCM10007315_28690 [Gemmobacter tilapiae]
MTARSREDIAEKFARHLTFLERSSAAFDDGFEDEDIRIAHSLRVLFHHTDKSHSIFHQLGLNNKILDTTSFVVSENEMNEARLIHAEVGFGGKSKFAAFLSDSPRCNKIPFENWWRQVVIKDQKDIKFSRRSIILQLSNKEGGSHVDPSISPSYEQLITHSLGFRFNENGFEIPPNNIASVTVRQIAHEVLSTFVDGYFCAPKKKDAEMTISGISMIPGRGPSKYSRNDLCPCESGLKYKKCHGFDGDISRQFLTPPAP